MATTPSANDSHAGQPEMDKRAFRNCLGQFATGVAVVAYSGDDGPRGATINSFTSVSINRRW